MLESIPAWVTALAIIVITVVIVLLVIAYLAPRLGRRLAQGFGSVIGAVLLRVVDGEIEQRTATLETLKSVEKEAFAMVETLKAAELDPTVPPKLLKLAVTLRIGQLKHRYETAILGLQAAQNELLGARRDLAKYGEGPRKEYRNRVDRLVAFVAEQELQIVEIEPLLDHYGVEYEKLLKPRLSIAE